jgi:hypothetical protein
VDLARGKLTDRELNPWEHLNYFSPESLRRAVRSAGLEIINPPGQPDIGLRGGLTGVRRLGNAIKSALRMVRYAVRGVATETLIMARHTCADTRAI